MQKPKNKVLLLTQYEMPLFKRNMNAYERIYRGAEHAEVSLIVRKNAEVSEDISKRVRVIRSFAQNRGLFIFHCFFVALRLRLSGYKTILTEPSGFAAVGFVAKYFAGYFWVMDVWDRPRWHAGNHEEGDKPPFSDRVVFWIMKRADFYVLSCLPRAAKDIDPPPEKCAQFLNAIELDEAASNAPTWASEVEPLRLAFARSKFPVTSGLQLIVETAEKLKALGKHVELHLVGEMTTEGQALIDQSDGRDLIVVNGFISEKRTEFFSKMHAGIVPYLPFEDVSYIFPIKVLEHLSQGNPVIASNLPGLTAVIKDGENGLLFEPGDAESLTQQVLKLLDSPTYYHDMAQRALASIYQYGAEDKVRRVFEAIFAAASKKGKS